jgi:hypothetical protein
MSNYDRKKQLKIVNYDRKVRKNQLTEKNVRKKFVRKFARISFLRLFLHYCSREQMRNLADEKAPKSCPVLVPNKFFGSSMKRPDLINPLERYAGFVKIARKRPFMIPKAERKVRKLFLTCNLQLLRQKLRRLSLANFFILALYLWGRHGEDLVLPKALYSGRLLPYRQR